ncbi:ABC transporter substrate-binding protein [Chelatococcus reniformis]|uniref:Ferrichrome ABC transporter substrate-binding protein n=1 Tax=Chelatococcus reniformis TaxID=1494448 RepID=A0A916UE00_9HYPH|nr:ABC transporter substrate-binding protein [Chelatococcus reniformis]GGC70146.1 ferrichrome ABC transporter substrate-binding protein [Chelatococcus reniformis]
MRAARRSRSPGRFVRECRAIGLGGLVAALLLVLSMPAASAQTPIRVTDIVGREVVLAHPARRIVLGAWVSLDALSLLHPDPVSLLAGWAQGGANAVQPTIMRARFPDIDKVPVVGRDALDTLSVEAILAARPDLVVLSQFDAFRYGASGGAPPPVVAQIEAAGIPVVVLDFFLDPLRHTEPSLRALGRLIGREAEAEAFLTFYTRHLDEVRRRVGATTTRPSVFFHAFADRTDCCFSAGPGTVNEVITLAGGHNIGADVLKGPIGQLSAEYVLAHDPDAYVATAISGAPSTSGFSLGPGVDAEQAATGFAALVGRPDLASLGAVRRGRILGLWHLFVHTPVHVVAVEALAKFLHPDSFADIDPAHTLDEINARFLAAPLEGTFWTTTRRAVQTNGKP